MSDMDILTLQGPFVDVNSAVHLVILFWWYSFLFYKHNAINFTLAFDKKCIFAYQQEW